MLTNDHNSIEIFKVSQNVFSLMSANELMTFMPPCSDFCKVVHSRRTLWVKKSFIDRCHQSHQLVFPFAVCWNDWRSESYTLYFMVLSLIWCDGVNVTEVLLSIHGFGFVRGSWSWWAAGSGNVWSQLRRSEILAGARRRQNLYGILLPGANIFRAFFRTGLVALWFALPFKPPISSPMPIRVWSDSILCKLIFSISSGHFSNQISFMKLLTDGCARGIFLQQKLCNVPACQDVVWSNLQMAHWCSLSLKGNFLWLLPW